MALSWYFRPEKVRHISFGYIMHSLVLTRFLVAAHRWAGESNGQFKIAEVRICYDLAGTPGNVSVGEGNKKEMLPVVPDAWMVIEKKVRKGEALFRFFWKLTGERCTGRGLRSMLARVLNLSEATGMRSYLELRE